MTLVGECRCSKHLFRLRRPHHHEFPQFISAFYAGNFYAKSTYHFPAERFSHWIELKRNENGPYNRCTFRKFKTNWQIYYKIIGKNPNLKKFFLLFHIITHYYTFLEIFIELKFRHFSSDLSINLIYCNYLPTETIISLLKEAANTCHTFNLEFCETIWKCKLSS